MGHCQFEITSHVWSTHAVRIIIPIYRPFLIWKGVSATLQRGRYTLSHPRGRYIPIITWKMTKNVRLETNMIAGLWRMFLAYNMQGCCSFSTIYILMIKNDHLESICTFSKLWLWMISVLVTWLLCYGGSPWSTLCRAVPCLQGVTCSCAESSAVRGGGNEVNITNQPRVYPVTQCYPPPPPHTHTHTPWRREHWMSIAGHITW